MSRIGLFIIVGCLMLGCRPGIETLLSSKDNVQRIEISRFVVPGIVDISIPSHELSLTTYQSFLEGIKRSRRDRSPAKWQVLGEILITDKARKVSKVTLYWTGESVGAFSIDGVYYRGANDSFFIKMTETLGE